MRRTLIAVLCAASLTGTVACSDFLSGPGLTTNPNQPSEASADQLFVGLQVGSYSRVETTIPLLIEVWSQHLAGASRQWVNLADYSYTETTDDAAFNNIYGGGGLIDVFKVKTATEASGNKKFLGIAQVYEALLMGTATSWYGDIPYSEAVSTVLTPKLDPQATVYARIQSVLDSAITNLSAGGAGPAAVDFAYGNSATKWTEAAHSLKARYWLHQTRGPDSLANYVKARDEAALGISSRANDWMTTHTSNTGEHNLMWEFLFQTRAGDIEPDSTLINMLKGNGILGAHSAQLLDVNFTKNSAGQFEGAPHDRTLGSASNFRISVTSPTPILTYAETKSILAETQYRTGQAAAALITLNAIRAAYGEAPVVLAGPALLQGILEQKYVTNYLNTEVWSDYRRTCFPNLTLPRDKKRDYIPARIYYGFTERIANSNIPTTQAQDQNPTVPAFPKNLTDPFGNPCIGQKDRPGT